MNGIRQLRPSKLFLAVAREDVSYEKHLCVITFEKKLGKAGKVWYNRKHGVYRLKESRERRAQGDTQAGRTAQENGENGKRN